MKKVCQYSKCGKEFIPNKPRQQYCSDIHRVYANREKAIAARVAATKQINPEAVQAKIKEVRKKIDSKKKLPQEQCKEKVILPGGIIAYSNEEIHRQIVAIRSETIPEHRNTPLGKKSWAVDQQKRIDELKKQLK